MADAAETTLADVFAMPNTIGRNRNRARTGSLSLLAIDDEPGVLDMVRLCCRKTGWSVTAMTDLTQGLSLKREALPDLILCDAVMPGLTGPQLISMLKGNAETAHIPVVLMSGFASAEMFSHVPWAGFLEKPFGPKELRAAIESAASLTEYPR